MFTTAVDPPTPAELIELRARMGWGRISSEVAAQSLRGALHTVGVRDDDGRLVALGRLIGDGVLFFYVADLMVHPEARGQGLGDRVLTRLRAYIDAHAADGASVAVLAAPGRAGVYERHGFTPCPNPYFGRGLAYLRPIERWTSGTSSSETGTAPPLGSVAADAE